MTSVSPASQTLKLAQAPGRRPVVVKITPGTRIWLDGRAVSLAGIPRGRRIAASVVSRNGVAFARGITVQRLR